jgi:hypothetical protein
MEQSVQQDGATPVTSREGLSLSLPLGASTAESMHFESLCERLTSREVAAGVTRDRERLLREIVTGDLHAFPYFAAAAHAVIDLVAQGWAMSSTETGPRFIGPDAGSDRDDEKRRIQDQELVRREAQLQQPSVRKFVGEMERPRSHGGRVVSIFTLIQDGSALLDRLAAARDGGPTPIDPYAQVVDDSRCNITGLRLQDIWRYFRHTWSNAYSTVPGRSMGILIRDRANPNHPVIGIAALSSPVVQIAERDKWIGWDSDGVTKAIREQPTEEMGSWIKSRIAHARSEIFAEDLLRDGIVHRQDFENPTLGAVTALRKDAERFRTRHHNNAQLKSLRLIAPDDWRAKAETDLFRSKRSLALAEALESQMVLGPFFAERSPVEGLQAAAQDRHGARQLKRIVRRARGERVGTVIADLTVCGAVAPYSALAAGKLVGAMAVSPTVLRAYHRKYARPSEIASSIAGRPIVRESRLAYIGTTSLYSTGSSQYNRLFWPAAVMGGPESERMGFNAIGRSRSFGTSHFSDATISAFVRLSSLEGSGVRVNGLFGEGVSPRLRKVRLGLTVLGWPANDLMKHGRQRLVYGVPLVKNLSDYSIGIEDNPDWLLDPESEDSDSSVGHWWLTRWGERRAQSETVRQAIASETLTRPIHHHARVALPPLSDA